MHIEMSSRGIEELNLSFAPVFILFFERINNGKVWLSGYNSIFNYNFAKPKLEYPFTLNLLLYFILHVVYIKKKKNQKNN